MSTTAIIDVFAGWLSTFRSSDAGAVAYGEFDQDDDVAASSDQWPSPLEEFY